MGGEAKPVNLKLDSSLAPRAQYRPNTQHMDGEYEKRTLFN
jgi:hypothetical protein